MDERWRSEHLQRRMRSATAAVPRPWLQQRLGVSSNKRAKRRARPLRFGNREERIHVYEALFEVGGAGDAGSLRICHETERLRVEHVARATKEQQLANPTE